MKKASTLLLATSLCLATGAMADAGKGKEYFHSTQGGKCATCHATSETKLVGPGLGSVMTRHSEEWVMSFITDPQKAWETDHPETIELKKRIRGGMTKRYTSCQKAPMTAETKQDLIDFFKTLSAAPPASFPAQQGTGR